jgi:hypothetical protein
MEYPIRTLQGRHAFGWSTKSLKIERSQSLETLCIWMADEVSDNRGSAGRRLGAEANLLWCWNARREACSEHADDMLCLLGWRDTSLRILDERTP